MRFSGNGQTVTSWRLPTFMPSARAFSMAGIETRAVMPYETTTTSAPVDLLLLENDDLVDSSCGSS